MRIVVYGAGAIGSAIGGYLHASGAETVLVCSPRHAKAIAERGLRIRGERGDHTLDIPAVADIGHVEWAYDDVVFLTMKSFDTASAIDRLGDRTAQLPAVCFQNGIGNEPIAAARFARTYGGLVLLSAKFLQPGVVTHTTENTLGIGRYPQGTDALTAEIAGLLRKAGFHADEHPQIMGVKWTKLFYNVGNGLFAILGVSVKEGFQDERTRFLLADILEEAYHVVQREGIDVLPMPGRKPPAEMIAAMRQPGQRQYDIPDDDDLKLHTSMWQDLYLKRGRTEVADLNGEIVRLGRKNGIETPLNTLLLDVVNRMASARMPPGAYTLDVLLRALQK